MVTCCENMQEILKFTIKCYMKAEDQVGKKVGEDQFSSLRGRPEPLLGREENATSKTHLATVA